MKNIFRLTTGALLSLSLFCGCIEETFPTDGATSEQVAESTAALDAMVNALPTAMMMPGNTGAYLAAGYPWDFAYPAIHIMLDTMCEDLAVLGETGYDHFAYYALNLGLGEMYYMCILTWDNYYPWIKNCNDIISSIKGSGGTGSQAFLGIAYAYRAQFYLDLVRLYEGKENEYAYNSEAAGLGVPLVTEDTSEEAGSNNPRATVEEVYEQIFSDLKNAEECLEGYRRTSKSRPDQSVVYGIYARAYLELGEKDPQNYAKAAEYARKAIETSGCKPLTQDQWEDPVNGFNNMSSQDSWMLGLPLPSEQVSNLLCFTAHMSTEESWTNYGWNVCRGINKALYDKISNKDFRKHSWLDPDRSFYNYKSCRPDGATHFAESLKSYANIKFRPAGGNYSDYRSGGAADHPLMRVEEMYLIEAEAAGMVNLEEGKRLLNEFMKYRILDGSYNCAYISSAENFRTEVILQKRIEFWGEGIVFFDYKRLGLGITRGYSGTNHQADYRYNCNKIAPWWNFCIPRTEIQNNSGIPQSLNNPDPSDTVPLWR